MLFALALIFLGGPLSLKIGSSGEELSKSKYREFSLQNQLRLILTECSKYPLTEVECQFLKKTLDAAKDKKMEALFEQDFSRNEDFKKLSIEQRSNIIKYLTDMIEPENVLSEESLASETFKNYWNYKHYHLVAAQKEFAKFNVAQKDKLNPWTLLISQIAHSGMLHLAGNLLIILFFGFILEQRVPWYLFVGIFLTGGFAGIAAQVLFEPSPYVSVFGASAGATAIIGAVVALFWNRNIRFFILPYSFIVRREIRARVWWSVPLLFITTDLIILLTTKRSDIAVVAHLVGFATGFGFATIYRLFRPLGPEFIFNKEEAVYQIATETKNLEEKEVLLRKILVWNPDNFAAMEDGFQLPGESGKKFYKDFGSSGLALHHREKRGLKAHKIISMVEPEQNLAEIFTKSGKDTLQWLGDASLDIGDWFNAIRAYSCFIEKFEDTKNRDKVYETISGLLEHGMKEEDQLKNLRKWYHSLKNTSLIEALSKDFPQLLQMKESS